MLTTTPTKRLSQQLRRRPRRTIDSVLRGDHHGSPLTLRPASQTGAAPPAMDKLESVSDRRSHPRSIMSCSRYLASLHEHNADSLARPLKIKSEDKRLQSAHVCTHVSYPNQTRQPNCQRHSHVVQTIAHALATLPFRGSSDVGVDSRQNPDPPFNTRRYLIRQTQSEVHTCPRGNNPKSTRLGNLSVLTHSRAASRVWIPHNSDPERLGRYPGGNQRSAVMRGSAVSRQDFLFQCDRNFYEFPATRNDSFAVRGPIYPPLASCRDSRVMGFGVGAGSKSVTASHAFLNTDAMRNERAQARSTARR